MYQPAESITMNTAKTALEAGLQAIAGGQQQIVLSGLHAVDSSAVATLLAWRRAADAIAQPLVLSGAPANLQSLVGLYDLTQLLHLSDVGA